MRPTLVLIHGGFCAASDWAHQVSALGARYPIVAEDLPGHGGAPVPARASVEALADAVCNAKVAHARVLLVGHSLGCAVALETYRQAPNNVAGIVLIEGGMGARADPARTRAGIEALIASKGIGAFLIGLADLWFPSPSEAALRERARARLARFDASFAQELLFDAIDWESENAAQILSALRAPVLALQSTRVHEGVRQSLQPNETTPWLELVRSRAPHARITVLPGLGHFPHVQDASVVNDAIDAFAQSLELAS